MHEDDGVAEWRRNWTAPAELAGSAREVRLTGSGIVVACLAAAMFLGAIAAAVGLSRWVSREAAEAALLAAEGVETEGVITRLRHTGGKSDSLRVAYEFDYGGRIYQGSARAPRRLWKMLRVGDPIEVRFARSRPELNHASEWSRSDLPGWMPGVIAAAAASSGMLMLLIIRRQMQLLSEGRAAPGRITGHRRSQHGHMVKYEFAMLDGSTGTGRSHQGRKPPPVGAPVTVIYDRDNPKRHALYPLQLVRVVR